VMVMVSDGNPRAVSRSPGITGPTLAGVPV
jgi:hypothetical protein